MKSSARKTFLNIQIAAAGVMTLFFLLPLDFLNMSCFIASRAVSLVTFVAAIVAAFMTKKAGLPMSRAKAGIIISVVGFVLNLIFILMLGLDPYWGDGENFFLKIFYYFIPSISLALFILPIVELKKMPKAAPAQQNLNNNAMTTMNNGMYGVQPNQQAMNNGMYGVQPNQQPMNGGMYGVQPNQQPMYGGMYGNQPYQQPMNDGLYSDASRRPIRNDNQHNNNNSNG